MWYGVPKAERNNCQRLLLLTSYGQSYQLTRRGNHIFDSWSKLWLLKHFDVTRVPLKDHVYQPSCLLLVHRIVSRAPQRPATFQKCKDVILLPVKWKSAIVYLDDMIDFLKTVKTICHKAPFLRPCSHREADGTHQDKRINNVGRNRRHFSVVSTFETSTHGDAGNEIWKYDSLANTRKLEGTLRQAYTIQTGFRSSRLLFSTGWHKQPPQLIVSPRKDTWSSCHSDWSPTSSSELARRTSKTAYNESRTRYSWTL